MRDFTGFGGRRFVLAAAAGLVATALQWCGKLDPNGSAYSVIVIGTVAAYITGGTAEAMRKPTGGEK